MQTAFTYNGVLVKDVLTESIDIGDEKDSTGVDQLGIRCRATFTGVLHAAAQEHTGKRLTNFQGSLDDTLMALSKDRRAFVLTMGGVTFLDVKPGAAERNAPANTTTNNLDKMDIANGPIPHVEVLKIVAGRSATIRFTLEWVQPNCGGPGTQNTSGLINFRLWIAENVDCRSWLTTRTFIGRIRVAHKNISPHALARIVTIPPLENGFDRQFIRWDESPDGLHLDFAFQDVEIVAAAPYNRFAGYGATKWSGRLTHSTETMGATSNVSIAVTLSGPKSTSILELADLAYRVVSQKLQYQTVVKGQRAFFEYFEIGEELSENVVECNARIKHTGATRDLIGLFNLEGSPFIGVPMGELGIGYDSNVAYVPQLTAGIGNLFLSALQTACNPNTMPQAIPAKKAKKPNKPKQQSQDAVFQSYATNQIQTASAASLSQLAAMYFSWKMTSELYHVSGKIALATGAEASNQQTDSPVAIVNLHRAITLRQYLIEAERLNVPPELPSFLMDFIDVNGIGHTMYGTPVIAPSVPQLSADGRNLLHGAHMEVCYAMARAVRPTDKIAVGTTPYRKSSFNDPSRILPPSVFVDPRGLLS